MIACSNVLVWLASFEAYDKIMNDTLCSRPSPMETVHQYLVVHKLEW